MGGRASRKAEVGRVHWQMGHARVPAHLPYPRGDALRMANAPEPWCHSVRVCWNRVGLQAQSAAPTAACICVRSMGGCAYGFWGGARVVGTCFVCSTVVGILEVVGSSTIIKYPGARKP